MKGDGTMKNQLNRKRTQRTQRQKASRQSPLSPNLWAGLIFVPDGFVFSAFFAVIPLWF